MNRCFGPYDFQYVGAIQVQTDETGNLVEYTYKLPDGVRPNRYASGPFCKFKLDSRVTESGVYAITVGGNLRYIGECENLLERFGSNGYGYIAARNCHHDGQATNCKINSHILGSARSGQTISVWFYPTTARKYIETELRDQLNPPWNGRLVSPVSTPTVSSIPSIQQPSTGIRKKPSAAATREDFLRALQELFAEQEG